MDRDEYGYEGWSRRVCDLTANMAWPGEERALGSGLRTQGPGTAALHLDERWYFPPTSCVVRDLNAFTERRRTKSDQ